MMRRRFIIDGRKLTVLRHSYLAEPTATSAVGERNANPQATTHRLKSESVIGL